MKKELLIVTVVSFVLRYVLSLLLDKAWVKGMRREVPKNNGVDNSLVEYLFYIVVTGVISGIFSRQISLFLNKYVDVDSVEGLDFKELNAKD